HFGTRHLDYKDRRYSLTYGITQETDDAVLYLDDVTDSENHLILISGVKTENGDFPLRMPSGPDATSTSPRYVALDIVEDLIGWMKNEL
ncbi:MAG: hypothetical protein AAF624_02415, partial [Bacteroidota bacterium]